MATKEELLNVMRKITGDPTSGAVADVLPELAAGVAEFLNPPGDATRSKTGQETRLMNPIGETR